MFVYIKAAFSNAVGERIWLKIQESWTGAPGHITFVEIDHETTSTAIRQLIQEGQLLITVKLLIFACSLFCDFVIWDFFTEI